MKTKKQKSTDGKPAATKKRATTVRKKRKPTFKREGLDYFVLMGRDTDPVLTMAVEESNELLGFYVCDLETKEHHQFDVIGDEVEQFGNAVQKHFEMLRDNHREILANVYNLPEYEPLLDLYENHLFEEMQDLKRAFWAGQLTPKHIARLERLPNWDWKIEA